MKGLIALTLSLASLGFVATSAEAKASAPSASRSTAVAANATAVQWGRRDRDRDRDRVNRRGVRVVTRTRLVRSGRRLYRETYQVRYLPNGRTQVRLISRVRVR